MAEFIRRCQLCRRWLLLVIALLPGAALRVAADAPATAPRAIPNADVPPFGSLSAETDGQKLYETICQGCHMPDARGAKGAGMYPALAANPPRLGAAETAVSAMSPSAFGHAASLTRRGCGLLRRVN